MDAGMRGSAMGQDTRFKDKEAASIKATKFPKNFNEKVDLRKVNLSVLRGWIANKVTELIRIEDDVVVEYVFGMLEDKDNPMPDPRKMQVSLVGFMNKYGAASFMEALWALLLSAQSTVGGVPAEFIAAKKAELEQRQLNERNQQDASRPPPRDGRAQASDSFDRNPRDSRPPPRAEEHDYRKGPPPRRFNDRDGPPYGRDRDRGYGDRERDRGYGGRYGGDRSRDDRNGDGGYGMRGGDRGGDRYERRDYGRPRSRSPPRYRRRSPSPRRRSPSPRRRRSPSPRARSITPPLRTRGTRDEEEEHNAPARRRSPSPMDDPPRRARSRTPTASDHSRGRSRSPTVTPPLRGRRDSTPPARGRGRDDTPSASPATKRRRRSPSDSRSPPRGRRSSTPPPRRRSPSPDRRERDRGNGRDEEDDGMNRKGRGRFTVEEEEKGKKKLEGRLGQSKWARDD